MVAWWLGGFAGFGGFGGFGGYGGSCDSGSPGGPGDTTGLGFWLLLLPVQRIMT